jgi:hypothetical protein
MVSNVECRDCRDLSLFTRAQLEAIRVKTNHVFGFVEAANRVDL